MLNLGASRRDTLHYFTLSMKIFCARLCKIIIIRCSVREVTRVPGEYPSRREFNIGGIHFQSDVPVLWFIANEYVRAFYSTARRHRRRRCAVRLSRGKKIRGIFPFFWFSYPNNRCEVVAAATAREPYLDAEISFATYGKYFPKTRKASPNPRRVCDITASGESFVALPLLGPQNAKKQCNPRYHSLRISTQNVNICY